MTETLVIDPGHGGYDSGAAKFGLLEKHLVLDIAKRIQAKLKDYTGIKVIMTRTTDKYLSLAERANIANKAKADAFLSIHINAGGGTGFESFIYNGGVSDNTHNLQNCIHSATAKQIGGADRGKKRANFLVLWKTNMSGTLTENLFIDRKEDAEKLKDSKFIDKIAQGHVDGIVKHFNLKKRVVKVAKDTPSDVHKKGWDWLTKEGITNGTNPKGAMTRQQLATMLHRYHTKFGK